MKLTFLIFLFKSSWSQNSNEDEIAYYENLIATGREEALNYEVPKDNEQFRPQNSCYTEEFGIWDFIIVGAGCGGAVVANRLSEVKKWKILLIEAGGQESNFSIIPANHVYLTFSNYNWGYYSTHQKHSCLGMKENRCPIVRGRALGGSSMINYEFYARGNKDDFDRWAIENPGWTYRECLPYFIKSENSQVESDPGYHGRNGYWNVKYVNPLSNQSVAFIEGSSLLHNLTSADYNGRNQLGAFQLQVNNRRQFRHSANAAFLQPIIKERKNLKIITNALVTKVLICPKIKRARGVIFSRNGKQYRARARNEVIVAAGATNTPQLLMLSGIGPREHLEKLNISVVSNLPVGKTLYDHALFYSAYVGINVTTPNVSLHDQVVQFLDDYGPLTQYSYNQVIGFYQSKFEASSTYLDIEIILALLVGSPELLLVRFLRLRNETYDAITKSLTFTSHLNVIPIALNTTSVGSVTLQSKDPYMFPLIDPNFLAEKYDVEILYQGLETIKKIIDTEPLRKLNATLILVNYPQCRAHEMGSKDYWICAFRLMTGSANHPSGTCRMGPNPKTSVVNNKGIVHGFHNLRIVDVSIFPSILAGHTAAPTVMMAEKISDYIKMQYGVPIEPITNTIL